MVGRRLDVPQGSFVLARHPERARGSLQAWDAADEYVLHHLAETSVPTGGTICVVNDAFGALAVALADREPLAVSDSQNGHIALERNLTANGRRSVVVQTSLEPLPPVDVAIVKIPRSGGQLEDQLHRIRPSLRPGGALIGAGMAKRIHRSTLELFERIIGPTATSLARRKARLVHTELDPELRPDTNPWPLTWTHDGLTVVSHGGVFSARRVDPGTRLLLEALPEPEPGSTIVDLGCGNGVLGLTLARRAADAELSFVDESHRAIASARESWRANFAARPARFVPADRLVNVVERASVDLIVTNPPFHDDRSMGDAIAWDMFVDSHAVLRPGGLLLAVGNRHLGHHAKLAKIFGSVETVRSSPKFVVLRAVRD